MTPEVRAELDRLVGLYGDDASQVGFLDGTEDDWGDLVSEMAMLLGLDGKHEADQAAWDDFQDSANDIANYMPGPTIEQLYLQLLAKHGEEKA